MKLKGWDYLDHMVQACEELFECMDGVKSVRDFKSSVKTRRAAAMCLLDLGELFKSLGDSELNEYPSEHWHNIIGFRNRSAHGYHTLDFELVYSIAVNRVPPLYKFLKEKQKHIGV
jgi:uncharacterized protein with HEPN domain